MYGIIKALILIPVGFLIIVIALANREPIRISLDPFDSADPLLATSLPLWVALFSALALGVLIGGTAAWLVQAKHRRAERIYKRESDSLRRELTAVREEAGAPTPAMARIAKS